MAPHGWINGMKLFKYNYLRCGSSRRYYTQVNWPLFLWLACVITGWLEASLPMAPLFPKLYLKTSSSQSPVSNSSYLSISDIHKLHFVLYHSFIHKNVATYSTWNRLSYCKYIYINTTQFTPYRLATRLPTDLHPDYLQTCTQTTYRSATRLPTDLHPDYLGPCNQTTHRLATRLQTCTQTTYRPATGLPTDLSKNCENHLTSVA